MSEAKSYRYIGTRPVRPDGVDKVTGRAQYGADQNLPGLLHAVFVRSPHGHAKIKRIDTSAAEKMVGVHAVATGADFPKVGREAIVGGEGAGDFADLATNVMARSKVLYHGHAVAAVAATSQAIAEAAAAAIVVEYEPLPVVLTMDAALAADAPLLDEHQFTKGLAEKPTKPSNLASYLEFKRGDLAQGFAEADVIVERTYTTSTVHQGYIEPHACTVRVNEDGQAVIWCCTQGHFDVRTQTAKVLGLNMADIKVIASEIGGGFGGKTTVYLEPVGVVLSRKSGRPVKLVMTREAVVRASGPASASRSHLKIGAKKDGTITAMYAKLEMEAGAFAGSPVAPAAMCVFAPYKVDNFKIEGYDILVNKPKVAAYRAPGAPQALYASDSLMDELAEKLGMDPIDLRLKNAASEGVQATYGPKFPRVGFIECLQAAKAHPHYTAPLGPNEGRGIAAAFWFNAGMQSSAHINVNDNGTITIVEGSPDIGGSRASMALMAAEELGIPYESIRVQVGDTENAGFCNTTGGSRVTFATGMAVIQAARDVIGQMKQRAAAIWNVDADQVEWDDGQAVPKPGQNIDVKPLSFGQIAAQSGRTGGPISGRASLNARGPGPSFSVNICDLRVDPETGKIDVLRYTAIQDAGKAIHPSYVEGQMQGGTVQGLGWALNEEYVINASGVMENAGFLDYRVPVASDMPMIDTVIIEVPNPSHPYGVRGVGETPLVGPLPAAANAVKAATGVRIAHLPLSPPNVLAALEAAGK